MSSQTDDAPNKLDVKSNDLSLNTKNNNKIIEDSSEEFIWKKYKKHFFIFSEAGKPFYTRYGDETEIVGMAGVFSTLISTTNDDQIKSLIAGPLKMVFKTAGPIRLVCASRTNEPILALEKQLKKYHDQILSILTKKLHHILYDKPGLDVRNLLEGTKKHLDNLIDSMDHDPSYFLESVYSLKIHSNVRTQIGNILMKNLPNDVFYSMVITEDKIIQMARPKEHRLCPADIHMIMNLIKSSDSFRNSEAAVCPICLPNFNDSAYFYAHVWFLNDDVILAMISTKMDNFASYSECKDRIFSQLQNLGPLSVINKAVKSNGYTIKDLNINGLQHFIYHSYARKQITAPAFTHPYNTKKNQRRLLKFYENAYHRIFESKQPFLVYICVGDKETVYVWTNQKAGYQMFAAFSPLLPRSECIENLNRLNEWIKSQEDNLFINEKVW